MVGVILLGFVIFIVIIPRRRALAGLAFLTALYFHTMFILYIIGAIDFQ
jgi:hypothetical protein